MARALTFLLLLAGLAWLPPAPAQQFVRIASRAQPALFLHIERGGLEAGRIEPQWWSAEWRLEFVKGAVRLRNRWKPDVFLQLGPAEATWQMELLDNADHVRFRSLTNPDRFLVLREGKLRTAAAARDDLTSHWRMASASEAPYGGPVGAVGSGAARRARHDAAGPREWVLEQVGELDLVRVRDSSQHSLYYHLESGKLQEGRILPGWWSAQWKLEQPPGAPRFRLQNRWKPDHYLVFENGAVSSRPLRPGEPGAQWSFVEMSPPPAPPARWHGPD